MNIVLHGTINGPEARGQAAVTIEDDGTAILTLTELWVAPGAPDVRLYVTPRGDAAIDDAAIDLGPIQDGATVHEVPIPDQIEASGLAAVVVYCKVFSVHFGSASLSPAT